MTDYNLGTARGVIEIEYKGDGVKQASQDLQATGTAADNASKKYGKAGTVMLASGAVIAGGLALAVKSAATFEKQLSNVEAVSGASAQEMEGLRDKALQLGKDTQFSAAESASAIEELVKAGVSVQDVMAGAADATVALAAAGEVSMPEAAAIASNAMNQFGLAAKDLPGVADAIAGAANASAIDVREFGFSLSQVGAVANLAGATFDDTATAIALMGNAGIKGSDAGTSLKAMLNNLQPTTEKQKTLFEDLGLAVGKSGNAFYDAQGNLKSMDKIAGALQGSMEGLTKQQQQQALETLFGSDAIRAAAVLADKGAKGFDNMAKSMGKVSAADVAATKMDNLAGSFEMLKGSLETLLIQVGTPLLNGLRGIVDVVTSVLNVVLELPGPVLEAATAFAAVLSVGLLLVGAFLKLKALFMAMQAGFLLFTGPIILVVAAIAALVAAFVYFYRHSERFRAIVQQIGQVLKDYFQKAIAYVTPLLKQFAEFLGEAFQKVLPYVKEFASYLADTFMPLFQDLVSAVGEFVGALLERAQPAIRFLVTAFGILADVFTGTILPLLIQVGEIFYHVFSEVLGNTIRTMIGVFKGGLNVIIGIIKIFTGLLTGNWSKAWEGVKQVLRGVVGAIGSILKGLLSNAGAIIKGLGRLLLAGVKAIPGLLKGAGRLFLAAGKFLMDMFVDGIKNAAGLIQGIASNVWNFVKGLMNGAISKINSALEFTINPPGPGSVTINPPDIPQLSKGGVLSVPTIAWVAEAGKSEAVTPLDELWAQMDRVYRAGIESRDVLELPSPGRGGSDGTIGPSGRSRLVEGKLYIDKSGRAWIRGIAEDVYDGEERFQTTHGRMG